METPTNPFMQGPAGSGLPTREPLIMTSEEITLAVAIVCMGAIVVSCICIMAKLDWGKISGRRKRKKSILIKKAAKKLEAEGRLKNADKAVSIATAKKPKEVVKKVVIVPNGVDAPKKVVKTEDGKPVVWATRFEEDGLTEKNKPVAKETKPAKPGAAQPKKVIKDETGREVPWKVKRLENKPLMIFELSENHNAVPQEKFPYDTTPAVANTNEKTRIINNPLVKARRISQNHTIVSSDKESPRFQGCKVPKKSIRSDSVDSLDEFFEARRPSDVSLDMSLVMDEATHQPIFVFDSIPNTLRLS